MTLAAVRLWIAQWPEGETHHRVTAHLADGSRVLIAAFDGITRPDQTLAATLPAPLGGVVGVRVETPSSVSWVAWQEIELIATGDPPSACLVTARSAVNLRRDTSTANPPVGRLGAGETALARAATIAADGHLWLELVGGAFVRADVVVTSSECSDVADRTDGPTGALSEETDLSR